MRRARSLIVTLAVCCVAVALPHAASANPAGITITVTGGTPVTFTSNDNTSPSLGAAAPLTASITVTTKNGGGGSLWIVSPANPTGTGGATLNLALITVTCTDTGGSGWFNNGSATLVPGGNSAACGTLNASVNNKSTTIKITFTIDDRTLIADSWPSIAGFSLGGTAF